MSQPREQLTLSIARELGQAGMQQATDRAERESAGITDLMYAYLVKFATKCRRGDRFIAEVVTDAYRADQGFEHPADDRAWGGVFQRAQYNGVITIADFDGVRKKGHGTKGGKRWRSLVCGHPWTAFDFTPRKRGKKRGAA